MGPELSEEERREAIAYVDAVVARAEGLREAPVPLPERERGERPLVTRLTPGFVKRAVVRSLRYVLRHPFEHLAHPVEVRLEEQIGEVRGIARSALRRAEQNATELERLRKELDRRTRQPPA
jgi:hypothetical protein